MTHPIRSVGVIAMIMGAWCLAMPAAVGAQPQCAVPTFGLPRAAGTAGAFPFRIVSADFNGDARPDVATAGADGAAVLLGDGAGAFGPATFFARPDALDVVAADFNGDGDVDLAVSWKQAGPAGAVGTIDVRLGDGAGGFGPPASFAAGAEPKAMVAVDFDANGTVDIAAADRGAQRMLVLSGTGAGGFAAPINVPLGRTGNSIAFGHFNADSHVDFAVGTLEEIDLGSNTLIVLLGDGTGAFVAMPPANAGASVDGLVPTDFNADGKVDLILVFTDRTPTPRSHIAFYPGNGAGLFAQAGGGQLGFDATDIKGADLDGDGVGDVVVRDLSWESSGGVIHAHAPRPGPPPAARASFVLPTDDPAGLALADFDGDGRIDIVTPGSTTGGNLIVMLNKCGDVADVSVDVARTPEVPVAGEQITYTITARNAGPDPAEAYLELQLYPGADLRALETTLACANLATPQPYGGAYLRCDLGAFGPAAEVTVTMRAVGRGAGDPVTLLAIVRSTVPDPNPSDNEVEDVATTVVIGGRDLTVSAAPGGGTLLQWSGGQAQAGYLVRRFVDGVMTTFPEDGVPLSATTTTFTDPSPVSGRSNCYAIAPVKADGTPYGRSALVCRVPGTASGSDQVTLSLKLTPTNRFTVTWAGPSTTTGFVYWRRRTDTGETNTISFPASRKVFTSEVANPTCYVVIAYQQTTQLGNTDMFCAVPGFSTLPQ